MCQRALFLAVLLAACAPAPVAPRPVAAAPSKRAFVVGYREAANAFAIVDEVSNWFPAKMEPEYAEGWKKRFGSDAATDAQLAAWGDVRKRHWTSEEPAPGIVLGKSKSPDALALAFYRTESLEAALAGAAALIGADDANVLRATFALLKPKLDQLLAVSRAFESAAAKLQARLDDPKVTAFVAELARFYRAGDVPTFNVEYAWWPPGDSSGASVYGDTLLLRYDPTKDLAEAASNVDVPLHEVAHFVSQHQPEDQKRALSEAFVKKCGALPKVQPARIFEEPLAVAHQKMFLAQNDPAHFDRERPWYGDPWASISAKMIYDAVVDAHAHGRVLDERIALAAGRSCRELSALTR